MTPPNKDHMRKRAEELEIEIKCHVSGHIKEALLEAFEQGRAKGYLECLEEGPEVKAKDVEIAKLANELSDSTAAGIQVGMELTAERERSKAFVDLEKSFRSCKRHKNSDGVCCACADRYFEALAAYDSAISPKGEEG